MPGKVNPVHPGGRAAGRRAGDRQRHGDHDRRPPGPVRAQRADPADRPQPAAVDPPALDRARAVRREVRRRHRGQPARAARRSAEGTLAVATALNPFIGYDKAAEIVKDASAIAAARCARSRASTASTRRRSTRRSTCARSPRARRLADARSTHRARTTTPSPRSAARVEERRPVHAVRRDGRRGRTTRGRGSGGARRSRPTTSRPCARASASSAQPEAFEWVHEIDAVAARRRARGRPGGARGAADGARRGRLARAGRAAGSTCACSTPTTRRSPPRGAVAARRLRRAGHRAPAPQGPAERDARGRRRRDAGLPARAACAAASP